MQRLQKKGPKIYVSISGLRANASGGADFYIVDEPGRSEYLFEGRSNSTGRK
jgi:hypothetical protein